MNTLYVRFYPDILLFKLVDQDARLIALMNDPVGERSLLSTIFLLDRHYPISQLVWEYHEGASITTHCYAMAILERIFGVAKHTITEAPDVHSK